MLIVCAMRQEYELVRTLLRDFHPKRQRVDFQNEPIRHGSGWFGSAAATLVQVGVGPQRAKQTTRWALEQFRPPRVLVAGLAGGLDPTLSVGDLVEADRVVRSDRPSEPLACTPLLPQNLLPAADGIRRGTVVTVAEPAGTASQKQQLGRELAAAAVDMESYAVAAACQPLGIAVSVLRAIVDDAQTSLPPELARMIDASGEIRIGSTLALVMTRPWILPGLLGVARTSRQALRSLRVGLEALAAR